MKRRLLFASLLLSAGLAATAADFMVTTNGGDMYYDIVDPVALTCEYAPNPNGPYNLTFTSTAPLTATVTNPNDGQTYTVIGVGANAFKDGTINSDASSGTIAYNHMWWWPNTITYIRAGAFDNCTSNFPCARFNSGFTPGSIDKAAFINNKINQFNPAASGDYYKVTDYNAGNTGDASGRSGVLYCEENGVKTLLVYGGDHHRSSWEKKPDGTSAAANPYYTLTTSVDLTEWNVIGENAFYGNHNIRSITLGANLTAIETNAFKDVTTITSITCNAVTPPTGAVFEPEVIAACKNALVIPEGSEDAYRADENWGQFFSVSHPKLYLAGDFTDWATNMIEMPCDDDGNYSLTVNGITNGAHFKFVNEEGTVWYGGATNDSVYVVHDTWCTDIPLSDSGQNFKVNGSGDLTFTVSADMKLTITGWASGMYLAGSMTNWETDKEELASNNGIYTITKEMAAGDTFKFIDINGSWYGAVSNGNFVVNDEYLGQELNLATPGENFQMTKAGVFVLSVDKANMKVTITEAPYDDTPFLVSKIYYKPISWTEVEITPQPTGDPYNVQFDSASEIPETVTNNGITYTVVGIGENAFKNGSLRTKSSVSNAAYCMQFFWFPNTITYIRAGAFDGCTSNYPGIRFANMTEIDNTAFINNHINWLNDAGSGSVYKVMSGYASNPATGNHKDGILYKEVDGVKTLVFYPGDHHKTPYIYNAGDRTDNANYILTVNADLSDYNVIGANAFYNNTNIRSITLGANTTAIETDAFKGATAITSITCNATVPPTGAVFEDAVIAACKDKLVIPDGTEAAYRADANWTKFFSPAYNVTIAEGITNGTITSDKEYAIEGATVTLTATPDEGYQLDAITVMNGETAVETTATETGATFVMPAADVTVSAAFSLLPPPVYEVVMAAIVNGTVTADKGNAEEGETVTLTIEPATGYELETLTVTNNNTTMPVETTATENGATFMMPGSDVTVDATFAAIDYTITIDEDIEHGTVVADKQTANYGELVTLTVTPDEGYEVEGVYLTAEGVDLIVEVENNQFEMPAANVNVEAVFAAIDYTITVAEAEHGTVQAPATANVGETVTLTVTPDEGYELETITVMNGETAVAVENNQFVMPAAPVTVTATFAEIPPVESVITFTAAPQNGTVAVYVDNAPIESGAAVAEGATVTVVLTPDEGYKVANFSIETVDEQPAPGLRRASVPVTEEDENTYSFQMPGAPVTMNVEFAETIITAINDLRDNGGQVRYIDVNGRVSDRPFNGINIVVSADGTVTKLVK
ncbi:MAG: leucine-rich repeat protein [Muribaculaceae bacterium]|nr:leucine-rich repeat protein [Muribaculaceae bacterium]